MWVDTPISAGSNRPTTNVMSGLGQCGRRAGPVKCLFHGAGAPQPPAGSSGLSLSVQDRLTQADVRRDDHLPGVALLHQPLVDEGQTEFGMPSGR